MAHLPSVYDLTLDALSAWDFSRPLFVQASPAAQFTELVDAFHERLQLPAHRTTLLTNAAYATPSGWPGGHLRNPEARLSAATARHVRAGGNGPFSVVVATTKAYNLAMRFHSNVACFCHALEPVPTLLVTEVGQFAAAREFFAIANHSVGTASFVANMLVGDAEADALFEAARNRPAGHVVELGRFSGGTAVLLALAARAGGQPGVVSIDVNRLPAAEYFCQINGVGGDVQLIDGDSQAVAARWPELQTAPGISLLFVDADHSYEAVARDIAAWAPHVVDGGTIAMHDASTSDCGVAKAVYRHMVGGEGFVNFRQVGSTVLCERRRGHRQPSALASALR
ncbi:MAG: class I SAM-dependent methyltransferase [Acidobacteriota bacterium]